MSASLTASCEERRQSRPVSGVPASRRAEGTEARAVVAAEFVEQPRAAHAGEKIDESGAADSVDPAQVSADDVETEVPGFADGQVIDGAGPGPAADRRSCPPRKPVRPRRPPPACGRGR